MFRTDPFTDSDGTITKIQIFREDVKIAETGTSPLRYYFENADAGTYTLTAKAIDDTGAVTFSAPITITINSDTLCPKPAHSAFVCPSNLSGKRIDCEWYGYPPVFVDSIDRLFVTR